MKNRHENEKNMGGTSFLTMFADTLYFAMLFGLILLNGIEKSIEVDQKK